MGTGLGAPGMRGFWSEGRRRCIRLLRDYPKWCGAATWAVSLAAASGTMVLGDFGAPGLVFILLGLWLLTLGLPTVLATIAVLSLAPDVPVVGGYSTGSGWHSPSLRTPTPAAAASHSFP